MLWTTRSASAEHIRERHAGTIVDKAKDFPAFHSEAMSMHSVERKAARSSAKRMPPANQPDLFAFMGPASSQDRATGQRSPLDPPAKARSFARGADEKCAAVADVQIQPRQAPQPVKRARSEPTNFHLVQHAELPSYTPADIESVDQILAAWPDTKALFTYAEVRQSFGVSRATAARKIKAGLIPGIAFAGERVLADGPVRRLTRDQVKHLLLAVRKRA
jgi:hypothetical protein